MSINNKKLVLTVLTAVLLFTAILGGCSQKKTETQTNKGYSVTDEFGHTLHFTEKPRFVLGNTTNIEEILIDLVTPERMSAISESNLNKDFSLIADKAAKVKTKIPDRASIETVVALHPDLFFMQIKTDQAMADTLTEMGIRVYRMKTPVTLETIRKRIQEMSIAVGEPERGAAMVQELDQKIVNVKKRTGNLPKEKRKKVIAFSSLGASGSRTGVFHEICEESGVINGGAMAGIEYAAKISDEQIIKVDPDIFVVTDEGPENGHGEATVKKILADEALKNVKASKDRRFIYLKARYRIANSQHFGDAVTAIAKGAYPELFEN